MLKNNLVPGCIPAHHKGFFYIPLAATLSDNDDQAAASQNKSASDPLQALKENKE